MNHYIRFRGHWIQTHRHTQTAWNMAMRFLLKESRPYLHGFALRLLGDDPC